MTTLSEEALSLFAAGRRDEARKVAGTALQQNADDWHAHYVLGLCLRFNRDFAAACVSLDRANNLVPDNPSVLLALAIARQLNGEYRAAIDAIRNALEVDPDYAVGFNTLAMTQKLMGAYDKAAHNYDQGARALARSIARSLVNSETNPRLPHWDSRNSLWAEYAMFGGAYLAAEADVDSLAFPTGEMAAMEALERQFSGLYWKDQLNDQQKSTRLFLPNFFNTFGARLREDRLYATMIGNRGTVLRLMGKPEDAEQHQQEAEDFSQ
jgi:tetratricopeptide (TPR) repeat protein